MKNLSKSSTMRIDLIPDIPEVPLSERPKAKVVASHKKIILAAGAVDGGKTRSYTELFQNIYDAGIITDLHGRIRDVNRRALDYFGYTQEDLCDLDISDVVAGMDDEIVRTLYENVQCERFTLMTAVCRRADGTFFPAEIAVSQIRLSTPHLTFFIRDITTRIQQDEMLRTEHTALQNSSDAIVVIDMNSVIEYANPAVARIWGLPSPAEIINNTLGVLFLNADDGSAIIQSLAGENFTTDGVVVAKRANGTPFRAQIRAACNRNTNGEVVGAVISFTDLTERDRMMFSEKNLNYMTGTVDRFEEIQKCFLANLEELSSYVNQIRDNAQDEQVKKLVVPAADTCEGLRNLMTEYEELLHEVKDNISKMGETQLGLDD